MMTSARICAVLLFISLSYSIDAAWRGQLPPQDTVEAEVQSHGRKFSWAGPETGDDDSLRFLASLEKRDAADEDEPAHNHRAVAAVDTEDAEGIFDMLDTFIQVSQHDMPTGGHASLPAVTATVTSQPQQPSAATTSSTTTTTSSSSSNSSSSAGRARLQGWFGNSSPDDDDQAADEDSSDDNTPGQHVRNSYKPPRRHPKPDHSKYDSADDQSDKDTDSDADQEPEQHDDKYQKDQKDQENQDDQEDEDDSEAEGGDEQEPSDKGSEQYQQHQNKPSKPAKDGQDVSQGETRLLPHKDSTSYSPPNKGASDPSQQYSKAVPPYSGSSAPGKKPYGADNPAPKYQPQPPAGYQQPPIGYQQPPAAGYQQPPATGYQQPPATGYQQPRPEFEKPPAAGYQKPHIDYDKPPAVYDKDPAGAKPGPPAGYQPPSSSYGYGSQGAYGAKGQPGPPGPAGGQGIAGPPGAPGAPGARGEHGEQGEQGQPGQHGSTIILTSCPSYDAASVQPGGSGKHPKPDKNGYCPPSRVTLKPTDDAAMLPLKAAEAALHNQARALVAFGPTCSKVRPAQQQTGNETRCFSGGDAGDMVVVTANCATSDQRPTLGGRCAIECIDGTDYGFFVMAEITSFPAGVDYQPESPEWHPELQPVMCKARLTSSGTFSKSCTITATAMCCYDQ